MVGGGIGGLTAALALKRAGWAPTVLERARVPADAGSGISLWPNAMRVLDLLGVGDEMRRREAPLSAQGGLRRPDGTWLVRAGAAADQIGVTLLHRADLHAVLRAAVAAADVTVVDAADVLGVEPDRPWVSFRAGGELRTVSPGLVVGADGIRSVVRRAVVPDAQVRYAGYTSWRAVTRAGAVAVDGGGETWGRGVRFGYLPLTQGRVYWFVAADANPGGRDGDELAAARRLVGSWHDPVPSLLDATSSRSVLRLDICELAPLPTYVRGSVALLGDAAHAMTPDVGQGACQAIEDAWVLATALAGEADVQAALSSYDRLRRPRTQAIARSAHRVGRVAQASAPVAVALRDLSARLTPPRLAAAPLARVTGWVPPAMP